MVAQRSQATALILLAGGGFGARRRSPDPLLTSVLALCAKSHPEVVCVAAASGDDARYFAWTAAALREAGAGAVRLVRLTGRRAARAERAREQLAAADLVFVSGGDVEAGMQLLTRLRLVGFLRKLYAAGKPFAGVSAGSILLGRNWIRWADPENDASAGLFPCLGLAPLVCDTHAEADAWAELRRLLELQGPGAAGYGLPAGGGLRVQPDGSLEALDLPVTRMANREGTVKLLPKLRPACRDGGRAIRQTQRAHRPKSRTSAATSSGRSCGR